MSKKTKPQKQDEQVRTTVSFTTDFWQNDVEKLMKEEGYNNFSGYISFLLKLRRENLHQRRMEVARLDERALPASVALNEEKIHDPKRKAG